MSVRRVSGVRYHSCVVGRGEGSLLWKRQQRPESSKGKWEAGGVVVWWCGGGGPFLQQPGAGPAVPPLPPPSPPVCLLPCCFLMHGFPMQCRAQDDVSHMSLVAWIFGNIMTSSPRTSPKQGSAVRNVFGSAAGIIVRVWQ
eukprot:TRINITY_DN25202_c0_g1_i2.p2 TRINITY_DN25202_c0_g1~~TRINITY_DN25202_c0_g1_i2.p2  ORF type:complete len:141 (+),score=8.11 TRINITY_DN25202_c0_g1_i2:140-562(+)